MASEYDYKKTVERKENDVYSEARKSGYDDSFEDDDNGGKKIVYITNMLILYFIFIV